jgi:DUF3102 family protein
MNQIQIVQSAIIEGFNYAILDEDLATQCQAAAGRIKGRFRTTTLEIVEIGRDLIAIQDKMPHGAWGPWIEAEFGFTDRTAQHYMNTATFMEGKSETVSLLPPATLYALASPSADPDVVAEVLAETNARKLPPTADVKARLAKARTAQKKAQAAQKKLPEQIAKERAAEKRRQAAQEKADREHKEMWAERHALEAEAAKEFARGLVVGLGAGGALKLITSAPNMSLHQVKQQFQHPTVDGRVTFLTEQEIAEKFGGAP